MFPSVHTVAVARPSAQKAAPELDAIEVLRRLPSFDGTLTLPGHRTAEMDAALLARDGEPGWYKFFRVRPGAVLRINLTVRDGKIVPRPHFIEFIPCLDSFRIACTRGFELTPDGRLVAEIGHGIVPVDITRFMFGQARLPLDMLSLYRVLSANGPELEAQISAMQKTIGGEPYNPKAMLFEVKNAELKAGPLPLGNGDTHVVVGRGSRVDVRIQHRSITLDGDFNLHSVRLEQVPSGNASLDLDLKDVQAHLQIGVALNEKRKLRRADIRFSRIRAQTGVARVSGQSAMPDEQLVFRPGELNAGLLRLLIEKKDGGTSLQADLHGLSSRDASAHMRNANFEGEVSVGATRLDAHVGLLEGGGDMRALDGTVDLMLDRVHLDTKGAGASFGAGTTAAWSFRQGHDALVSDLSFASKTAELSLPPLTQRRLSIARSAAHGQFAVALREATFSEKGTLAIGEAEGEMKLHFPHIRGRVRLEPPLVPPPLAPPPATNAKISATTTAPAIADIIDSGIARLRIPMGHCFVELAIPVTSGGIVAYREMRLRVLDEAGREVVGKTLDGPVGWFVKQVLPDRLSDLVALVTRLATCAKLQVDAPPRGTSIFLENVRAKDGARLDLGGGSALVLGDETMLQLEASEGDIRCRGRLEVKDANLHSKRSTVSSLRGSADFDLRINGSRQKASVRANLRPVDVTAEHVRGTLKNGAEIAVTGAKMQGGELTLTRGNDGATTLDATVQALGAQVDLDAPGAPARVSLRTNAEAIPLDLRITRDVASAAADVDVSAHVQAQATGLDLGWLEDMQITSDVALRGHVTFGGGAPFTFSKRPDHPNDTFAFSATVRPKGLEGNAGAFKLDLADAEHHASAEVQLDRLSFDPTAPLNTSFAGRVRLQTHFGSGFMQLRDGTRATLKNARGELNMRIARNANDRLPTLSGDMRFRAAALTQLKEQVEVRTRDIVDLSVPSFELTNTGAFQLRADVTAKISVQ